MPSLVNVTATLGSYKSLYCTTVFKKRRSSLSDPLLRVGQTSRHFAAAAAAAALTCCKALKAG